MNVNDRIRAMYGIDMPDILRKVAPVLLICMAIPLGYRLATGRILNQSIQLMVSGWFVIGYLILSKSQPPTSIQHSVRLLLRSSVWPWYIIRDSSISPREMMNIAQTLLWGLAFFIVLKFIITHPTTSSIPESVRKLTSFTGYIGAMLITAGMIQEMISVSTYTFFQIIIRLGIRLYLLVFGIAMINHYAPDVAALLYAITIDPALAVTFGLAATMAWFLLGFAPGIEGLVIAREPDPMGEGVPGIVAIKRVPTEHDNRITATHEAGHALVYAALGNLPDDVKVVMHDNPSASGYLGHVTGVKYEHLLASKAFCEWKMLMFMGGQVGEEVLLGEASLGTLSDMTRWQATARDYLSNGFGSIYFISPENKYETAQNQATMDVLRESQKTLLAQFFGKNRPVLEDLAAAIAEKKELRKEDLKLFMCRVELVENFPKPNIPVAGSV